MSYIGSDPIPPNKGGTGKINLKTSTITIGGALSFTGAFTANFTLLGNSSVTMPLSGTLATTTVGGSGTGVSSFNINGVLISNTSTTGPLASLTLTNGQIVIGSTGNPPAAANITSTGGTLTITNGANTINMEVASGGFTWTDVTSATQVMAVENGYITDRGGGVVYTLPATAVLGAEMIVMGKLGLTTITPNANQQILIGSSSGSVGVTGTAVGNNLGDCITLVVITSGASTVWRAKAVVGTWTLS